MNVQLLKIAGLYYLIPSAVKLTKNYFPFLCSQHKETDEIAVSITIGDINVSEKELCHQGLVTDDSKDLLIYKVNQGEGGYYVTLKTQGNDNIYELYASPMWNQVIFSRNCESSECTSDIIDIFMMLVCIYSAAYFNTVFIHASCIKFDKEAVAFIGPSGVGKSTHSQLWLSYIKGTNLLNDDQPAVRILDNGKVIIYGTPWSGKTPCYMNESATLCGIIRMIQAPVNKITKLSPIALFQQLLSSCSMLKGDYKTFKLITSTLAKLSSQVAGFILENKPEKEAALMAYSAIKKKNV